MSAGQVFLRAVRRKRPEDAAGDPPIFWGRVGGYEGVTRRGVLFLLGPEPVHPSRRASSHGLGLKKGA